jgi:hypothetical protein
MTDVFHGMDHESVALWATTITFNFIDIGDLEVKVDLFEILS